MAQPGKTYPQAAWLQVFSNLFLFGCKKKKKKKKSTKSPKAVFGCSLKNERMILAHFQGKPFSITVIQVYAPNTNAKKAVVEHVNEDLQDLLELTLKKDFLFIKGDWNATIGSQEIPEVTGKFVHGVQ